MNDFAERRTVDGRLIERLAVPPLAASLGLEPHPEGGWYRRTWAGGAEVALDDGRTRPAATLILFLLPVGEASAWHRVDSDEIWIWNGLGDVALQLGGEAEAPVDGEIVRLGDVRDGGLAQSLVPGGVWQRTLPGTTEALVSCIVSPGFSFDDFALHED